MFACRSILVAVAALAVAFVSADEEQLRMCDALIDGFHSLPSAKNCSQYLLCVNKTAIIGACPQDLVWNEAVNQCTPPTQVFGSCGSAELLDNTPSCEGKSKRFYRVDGRCDMFYSCKSSASNITSKCETGAAFDERAQLCRPSIIVDDCHPPSSAEWLSFCVNKRNGIYEHGNTCGRVLACVAYEAYEFRCPTEKPYWNAELAQCVEEAMEDDCVWPVEPLMVAAPMIDNIDSTLNVTDVDELTTTAEPEITREPRDERGGKGGDRDDDRDRRNRCPKYCYRYRSYRQCYRHCPHYCC